MGSYQGSFEDNYSTLKGQWKQSGMTFPLDLHHSFEKYSLNRPQEPKPPFPYLEREVTIRNKEAKVDLAGTLTLPEKGGPFPAVILITGSGAQNRNEELMGHKPFLVLADYLTRKGIAVLRVMTVALESRQGISQQPLHLILRLMFLLKSIS